MLYYSKSGKGKNQIIFVHGNSSSSETWDDVVANAELQEKYSLVAVDLPGHGKSAKSLQPETDYSVFGMARQLNDFIGSFQNEKYILVANSLGANLAGEIAHDLENCKGIMIIGSSAFGKNLQLTDILQPNPNVGACFVANPTESEIDLLINDAIYYQAIETKIKIKRLFQETDSAVRSTLAGCVGKQEYSDELKNLEKNGLPLAVVFGEQEKVCLTDHLDKTDLAKWRNKTIIISEAGHFLQCDQPKALASLINNFAADCF